MCDAISLSVRELPTRYFGHPAIEARMFSRNEKDEKEVVFRYKGEPSPPLIPIIFEEQFRIVRWGNGQRKSKLLPVTGFVDVKDLTKPLWNRLHAQDVIIQAQALQHRRVWITVIEGVRGICVFDEHDTPTAFMVTVPSTDYYQIMTKSRIMPKLVGEVI